MRGVATSLRTTGWKRLSWEHPEWWTITLSVAAWLTIMAQPLMVSQSLHVHSAHAMRPGLSAPALSSMLMTVAMMFPMVLDSIRTVAARNLWRRRHRAILEFLAGYTAPWMLFCIMASLAIAVLQTQLQLPPPQAAALAFGAAVVWQLTPAKRRAILTCHRTIPIAATGWRADRDCFRSGWIVGTSCVASCWVLMLACILSDHSLPAMFSATVIAWIERYRIQPNHHLLCSALLLLAAAYMTMPYM